MADELPSVGDRGSLPRVDLSLACDDGYELPRPGLVVDEFCSFFGCVM